MSSRIRVLALLVPALVVMAADEAPVSAKADEAPAPAPAPAKAKAPAADSGLLNNLDLRLTVGGAGGITRVRDEDLDVDTDYKDGNGGAISLHLLYLRARPGGIGFAVGGGFFAHSHTGEPDTGVTRPESTVNAAGIDVCAAFVYRPTRNWHFELPAIVLSGGSASVETEGAKDSDTGWYRQGALQVGAYYTFDFGLQLGVDLGGSWFYSRVKREVALNVEREFTYVGGGPFLNLSVGFRF